jgi:hypothetical protein
MYIRSLTDAKTPPLKKGDTGGFAFDRQRKSPPAPLCQKRGGRKLLWIGVLLFLSACAPFQDTPYLEKEFGKASQAAWDAQIVNKGNPNAEKVPEGMAGITAEEIMGVKNKMFAEKINKSKIYDFGMQESR